ncbi:MAG: response regulator transcription factor [Bacteroidota bacterium]
MRALIVEDEPLMRESLVDHLKDIDFTVNEVGTFDEGSDQIAAEEFDLVLLDMRLPDGDGLDLLKQLRDQGEDAGVIILTAKGDIQDRVKGLDLGADDYLPKPFSMAELTARINAVLRRRFKLTSNTLEFGSLVIYLDDPVVHIDGTPVEFTPTEYKLLRYLALNRNKTVTRITLSEHIWGNQVDNRYSLDFVNSHIKNLRKKLAENGINDCIKTVYGAGYRFEPEVVGSD